MHDAGRVTVFILASCILHLVSCILYQQLQLPQHHIRDVGRVRVDALEVVERVKVNRGVGPFPGRAFGGQMEGGAKLHL